MRVDRSAKTGKPVTHGKASSYEYHGCRCDQCRAAQTEKMRKARASNPPWMGAQRAQSDAYRAALRRLREMHDADFRRIYARNEKHRALPVSAA